MLKRFIALALFLTTCIINVSAVTKRALLIGISTYPKYKQTELNWNNIHGANDVALIGKTLKKQGFSITTLTNSEATAKAIRNAFNKLATQTRKGDLVYIHFSGHGQPYEDLDGDETDGWDESIVPYDAGKVYIANVYEGENHIVDDELNKYVTNIRRKAGSKGFVYFVMDACHSGGASREEDEDSVIIRGTNIGFSPNGKPYRPKMDYRTLLSVDKVKGLADVCYLEACLPTQTNTEIKENGRYYGALSYYINKVLVNNTLSHSIAWIEKVRELMRKDRRLLFQDLVVERSGR